MALTVFFRASCCWPSEGFFGQSFSVTLPIQAPSGLPCLGSFFVVRCIRYLEGHPLIGVLLCRWAHQVPLRGTPRGVLLCSSAHQAFAGPASLSFSCQCWRVGGERLWWWLYPLRVTQQYCLVSMAAWLSPTDISHHHLLPHSQQQPSP